MTDDLTAETSAESRAALRAALAQMRADRDEARAGEARLIRAITGGQPADADRLRAICEAEVLRRAAAERDALRDEVARLQALVPKQTLECSPHTKNSMYCEHEIEAGIECAAGADYDGEAGLFCAEHADQRGVYAEPDTIVAALDAP